MCGGFQQSGCPPLSGASLPPCITACGLTPDPLISGERTRKPRTAISGLWILGGRGDGDNLRIRVRPAQKL